jgi:hypothetical protein
MDRRVLCVRPVCGSAAQAALHYDYDKRTVWLEPLGADLVPGAWSICAAHAEALRVPSGWELVDRRPAPPGSAQPAVCFRPPLAV